MPRLLVRFSPTKCLVFNLAKGTTVIGRGEACQLSLPNVSVSREHARIEVGSQNTVIEDLDSANGIVVNGQAVKQHTLKSGDEIQLGSFALVYQTGKETFYRGRVVQYMPVYTPEALPPHLANARAAGTVAMNLSAMRKLQQDTHVQDNARIVLMSDQNRYWYPQEKGVTFGNGGMIPVDAWFAFGVVATLDWNGGRHFLHQRAWWVPITVNGQKGTRLPLSQGAKFSIGNSRFKYDVPPLGEDDE